jgi:hypothetical protein
VAVQIRNILYYFDPEAWCIYLSVYLSDAGMLVNYQQPATVMVGPPPDLTILLSQRKLTLTISRSKRTSPSILFDFDPYLARTLQMWAIS